MNFDTLNLKKLIATGYRKNSRGIKLVYDSDHKDANVEELEGDGDFRSEECVKLLDEADVVVSNPPFSLFRPYVAQLVKCDKKFLIIGNMNAITYKEIFPLIKDGKLWMGYGFNGNNAYFDVPKDFDYSGYCAGAITEDGRLHFRNVRWFTNMDHNKRHEKLVLTGKYSSEKYLKYDNYDAINVDKVNDIPVDYSGIMGVPMSILDNFCPEQFEIVGELKNGSDNEWDYAKPMIEGKVKYARILIKRRA